MSWRPIDSCGSVISASARKHRISVDDMSHAYLNPIRVFDFDGLVMLIGPDIAQRLLEIGVAESDSPDVIVHAMPACDKFRET